jgi:hypothetical protein
MAQFEKAGCSRSRFAQVASILIGLAAGELGSAPLSWAADGEVRSNRIRVEYEAPKDPSLALFHEVAVRKKPLDRVQFLFSPLMLPDDIIVRLKECGVSNAWYQRPVVTICYEYVRDVLLMAPKGPSRDGITPIDAVLGQILFTTAHEMGHAVFDFLDIPILGRAEDAADHFAIYILLKIGKQEARRLIEGAAYMYKDYVGRPVVTVPLTAFADTHGSPMQRFYDLLCIGYGSDPDLLAGFIDYLPKERLPNCKTEFGEVNFAFEKLIEPHVDQNVKAQVLAKNWLPGRNAPPPRITDLPPALKDALPEGLQQSLK